MNEKNNARSFLENKSRCQMSLWFKCWILPSTQFLVFFPVHMDAGPENLRAGGALSRGLGQETREGDTVVLM